MNYALIENNKVVNIIWLYEGNEKDFPNVVRLKDKPVVVGDNYIDGKFYRNDEEILSEKELAEQVINILLGGE